MASWTTGTNGNGTWVKQPNGFIIQTGYIVGQSSGGVTITFPTAFTTAPSYSLIATSATNVTAIATSSSAASINNARVFNTAGAQTSNGIQWMAMGF
ncbi:gp53-like domain-containing protein [Citrobacter freundii]